MSAWNLLSRRWRCWQCQDEAEKWRGGSLGSPEIHVPLEVKSLQRSWWILLALKAGLSSSRKETPSKKSTSAICCVSGIQDLPYLRLRLFPSLMKKNKFLKKKCKQYFPISWKPQQKRCAFPIIGNDLAQGGGWAESTLKNPQMQLPPHSLKGWEQQLPHLD